MPVVKIFISHQQQDSQSALTVKVYLKQRHSIDCYLDVIDPFIKRGEEIAEHVRGELAKCTHLLAIVSDATKGSWWVPWEIGVATEKDYPLATYGTNVSLPEYLLKWPYLKTFADLDRYAEVVLETARAVPSFEHGVFDSITASTNRGSVTKQFYKTLRSKLGQ